MRPTRLRQFDDAYKTRISLPSVTYLVHCQKIQHFVSVRTKYLALLLLQNIFYLIVSFTIAEFLGTAQTCNVESFGHVRSTIEVGWIRNHLTYLTSESRTASLRCSLFQINIPPSIDLQSVHKEGGRIPPLQAYKNCYRTSIRGAAHAYDILESTLLSGVHGYPVRPDSQSVNLKVAATEESELILWMSSMDITRSIA